MNRQFNSSLTDHELIYWRIAQLFVSLIGIGIFLSLIFLPEIGIQAFWNVLIPIAPALLVISTGLWRNICPLATASLLFRHFGLAKTKRLPVKKQQNLQYSSIALLLLIVPLRHTLLDTNGPATALVIGGLALIAIIVGLLYDWKSAWCSGLCPVHPVEKLYGVKSSFNLPNAHCKSCVNCVSKCPDSTKNHGYKSKKVKFSNGEVGKVLMIGGFPGYIWGWFHVPDFHGFEGWNHLLSTYAYPMFSMLLSLSLYFLILNLIPKKFNKILSNFFAASAVSVYYWYRIPALIGFGIIQGDGVLIDLSHILPSWVPFFLQVLFTLFFIWWIVFHKKEKASWLIRPPFSKNIRPQSKQFDKVDYSFAKVDEAVSNFSKFERKG